MSVIDAIIAKKLCGGGGGSVPKPLTYDYMPEGYPSKSVQTITLMEEQELAFALSDSFYTAPITNAFEIAVGQTYTVKWDGTVYECVCSVLDSMLALGNLSIAGAGNDTGEPFTYGYNTKQATGVFGTTETSASHTISVKTTAEIVTPIAEEFLPAVGGAGQFIVVVYNANPAGTIFGSDKTYNDIKAAVESGACVVIHHKRSINAVDYKVYYLHDSSGGIYQFCHMGMAEGAVNFKSFTILEEAGEMVIEAAKNSLPAAT